MPHDEAHVLETVARRLTQRFPGSSPRDVEHAVQKAYERLEGRPIRDFVPVLVQRFAAEQLAGRSREATLSVT